MFKCIEPEVAGGFGGKTLLDTSTHPPIVHIFEYCFEGWLGDCLLETFPCFVMTELAKIDVENVKLTGIVFEPVIVSKSEVFKELYPTRDLPAAYWAKITGVAGSDDFGLTEDFRLVVSEHAMKVLLPHKLEHALIYDYETE